MDYRYLKVERKGDVFIIILRKPPENRLNVACCQELIKAYHSIQKELGSDAEGAVVLTGSDAKFFTTVSYLRRERAIFLLCSSDVHYRDLTSTNEKATCFLQVMASTR